MAYYCETIESSKTWTCPKTGVWKVICIGGGGGGYGYSKQKPTEYKAQGGSGGSTSFGSYLSAAGGSAGSSEKAANCYKESGNYFCGAAGIDGYNGASGYGAVNSNKATGTGYGASGGALCGSTTFAGVSAPGDPGDVKMCIMDLTVNATVSCTVGAAGAGAAHSTNPSYATAYAGKAGAIIVQYLGSSF